MTISNRDDIIDSGDVIERIDELNCDYEGIVSDVKDGIASPLAAADWLGEHGDELTALQALADEAAPYSDDWKHGAVLIRATYFREYAQQIADDIGAINANASWPNDCIDWDRAARELQMGYTQVDFDGVTYWVR